MAFCSCFLCLKLYACFRKIFGCKSHTHPSEGCGEDANADFYIGGVPQDKSSEILRLRNELQEVSLSLFCLEILRLYNFFFFDFTQTDKKR